MPPKAQPKPVTSAELMTASTQVITLAQRMLVNRQVTVDQYKSLIAASNLLTDTMIAAETKPANSAS